MRKPANLTRAVVTLVVLSCATAASAQERALNRVADGDFESGFVSLQLPPTAPLPMFWGGWAAHGARPPLVLDGDSFDGGRSLRIVAVPSDPVQVMQDLPLNGSGYEIRLAFLIEEGVQSVRLLHRGDDGQPDDSVPAFEAMLSTEAMRFATPDGSWQVNRPLAAGTWHVLRVFADPRTGAQSVRLDDAPLIALPGVAARRPSTLIVGGVAGERGIFRYDAVEVVSLIDRELNIVRDAAQQLDAPLRDEILGRVSAATMALERGSELLALPELGIARRLLEEDTTDRATLGAALDDLIELVEIDRQERAAGSERDAWF